MAAGISTDRTAGPSDSTTRSLAKPNRIDMAQFPAWPMRSHLGEGNVMDPCIFLSWFRIRYSDSLVCRALLTSSIRTVYDALTFSYAGPPLSQVWEQVVLNLKHVPVRFKI